MEVAYRCRAGEKWWCDRCPPPSCSHPERTLRPHGARSGPGRACGKRRTSSPDDFPIEERTPLQGASLGREIHLHDAEALRVAVLPLEVVEERPREVAAQVDSLPDRPVRRLEVPAVVLDTARVLDYASGIGSRIGQRGAVLGDVERDLAVALSHPAEDLVQTVRVHFPSCLC